MHRDVNAAGREETQAAGALGSERLSRCRPGGADNCIVRPVELQWPHSAGSMRCAIAGVIVMPTTRNAACGL